MRWQRLTLIKSLPEAEVAFAFSEVPAGMALHEEEDDEALDVLAAEAAAGPSRRLTTRAQMGRPYIGICGACEGRILICGVLRSALATAGTAI